MGMQTETQMEGPMGEMDIEPGEMDIEGPIANMLLRQLNMARPNVHPLHQEITLNNHVLDALQKQFGVNTTAAIQQKATDPEFQAFMFQVLQKSGEMAPGEFNANLTHADVNQILTSLQTAPSPVSLPRIASSEFAHASLQDIPAQKGEPASHHEAILTVDSGLGAEPSQIMPLTGHDPATHATHATNATQVQPAQTGTFEALVQDVLLTGKEKAEKKDKKELDEFKKRVQPNITVIAQIGATGTVNASQVGQAIINAQTGIAQAANNANLAPGAQPQVAPNLPAGDIKNKDGQPGLSKDARTAAAAAAAVAAVGPQNPPSTLNTGQPSNAVIDPSLTPNGQNQAAMNNANMPIGLQEAGLYPGTNGSGPIVKIHKKSHTATAFAIIAIVAIAVAIIIGPIICMLCKMKDKHSEKRRKLRSLKNRDISENNIMEAMMLHDLGTKEITSVENHGAMGANYYTNEGDVYQTIDQELEHLNHGRESPTGRLP